VTDLRFGVSLASWPDGPALLAAARTAEREGFDAVTVADHLAHTLRRLLLEPFDEM
jgi:alkanesulfonate monooxygenase SsuD/methylene tetrahydromethanopterin reductase-like flavin-dependent oxidoreductase (luciferase family)